MRIIDKPIENPPIGVYSKIKEFAVAEVDFLWMNDVQSSFPDEWIELHNQKTPEVNDVAIHLWLKKYRPELLNWLIEQEVDWIGVVYSEYYGHELNETICIRMHRDQDVTAFRLTWG